MNVRPVGREHTYTGHLTWTGAAAGPARVYAAYSREYRVDFPGKPPLVGSADPAFRGDAALHNPEELLVAARWSCHMLTYLALCTLARITVESYRDEAVGTMVETGGVGRFTRVVLHPRVTIGAGDPARARALHERAHAECFVAASVNFPVEYDAVVVAGEAAAQ